MADEVHNRIRRAAREIVAFSVAGVRLSLENIDEIYIRHGLENDEEAMAAVEEVKGMGREYLQRYIRTNDLGLLGTALVAKFDLKMGVADLEYKVRRVIGK